MGFPTTVEFFDSGHASNQVYAQLQRYYKTNTILDVEIVLSLIQDVDKIRLSELGKFLSSSSKYKFIDDVSQFYSVTRKRCIDIYLKRISKKEVHKLYYPLLKFFDWKNKPFQLFTTNYDIVQQHLFALANDFKLESFDGFNTVGSWNPSDYGKIKNGIEIYNLHGSLAWNKVGEEELMINRAYTKSSNMENHLILYPGDKIINDQGNNKYFHKLHNRFNECLNKAKALIVIGFAFRDEYINQIIINNLGQNKDLKLIVLNPNSKLPGLESIHKNFDNRIVHIEEPFDSENYDKWESELTQLLGELEVDLGTTNG